MRSLLESIRSLWASSRRCTSSPRGFRRQSSDCDQRPVGSTSHREPAHRAGESISRGTCLLFERRSLQLELCRSPDRICAASHAGPISAGRRGPAFHPALSDRARSRRRSHSLQSTVKAAAMPIADGWRRPVAAIADRAADYCSRSLRRATIQACSEAAIWAYPSAFGWTPLSTG